MKRDIAVELLDAARDGAPVSRKQIAQALVATGDAEPKLWGTSGKNLGGIRSIEDIRLRCYVDDITGCWHWRGCHSTGSKGGTYKTPCMRIPELGSSVSAGVAICFFKTGARPAKGKVWHVTCSTPNCCNPEHRKAGTKSSMNKSPAAKKFGPLHAQRVAAGRRKQSTICNAEIAAAIRASDEPLKVLADRYKLGVTYVSKIRLGKLWRPLVQGASVFSLVASA